MDDPCPSLGHNQEITLCQYILDNQAEQGVLTPRRGEPGLIYGRWPILLDGTHITAMSSTLMC